LNPSELQELREQAQERLERTRADAEVNSLLQQELMSINDRDIERVRERLEGIEQALASEVEEFDRLLYGGSIAKHTWVDGVSDVDSLVVLSEALVGDRTPAEMRAEFEQILRRELNMGDVDSIRVGRMAVTVTYRDGTEIQLLPAVQRGDALEVSPSSGNSWARIDPRRFSETLTSVNREQGGAVVPAIKIAKAILAAQLSEDQRPTGYHIEALAVSAFSTYEGQRTPKAMAQHLLERASSDVLRPISDITGQSRYVDSELGGPDSDARRSLAGNLERITRSMQTSTSAADWKSLLDG
jgi:hypothetical protein